MEYVALFILKFPRPNDDEIAFADPHPLFHLPWDATEARFPVRAHDANARSTEQLIRDSKDLPLSQLRNADADLRARSRGVFAAYQRTLVEARIV